MPTLSITPNVIKYVDFNKCTFCLACIDFNSNEFAFIIIYFSQIINTTLVYFYDHEKEWMFAYLFEQTDDSMVFFMLLNCSIK